MGRLDGCEKCGNPVLTYGHFVHEDTGEVIPEISCFKCGWRLIPKAKCTLPDDKPLRPVRSGGIKATRVVSGLTEVCKGCGQYRVIRTGGMCGKCVKEIRARRKAITERTSSIPTPSFSSGQPEPR